LPPPAIDPGALGGGPLTIAGSGEAFGDGGAWLWCSALVLSSFASPGAC
jgi:hypothetical protein